MDSEALTDEQDNPNEHFRKKIGFIGGIALFFLVLFLPAPEGLTVPGQRLAAITTLMTVWWLTEAKNLAVTALIPLALFPLLGVSTSAATAKNYANPNIFLFLGGFMLANAMQKWNLHKRLALWIIGLIGGSYRRIIAGFMIASAFLSMWVSNTATTMMLLPIGLAVIDRMKTALNDGKSNIGAVLMLSIAYAASCGGIATLIGTPPNIVFVGQMATLFPEMEAISFVQWILFALPLSMGFLFFVWFYLSFIVARLPKEKIQHGKAVEQEFKALGPLSKGEKGVLVIFLLTALAWMTRSNITIEGFVLPGWQSLLGLKGVHDGTVAIVAAIVLFTVPLSFSKYRFILDWKWARKIPWGIILLFGGGFALAGGFKETGLAAWISSKLIILEGLPPLAIVFGICLAVTFLTEITSNTATATLLLPILASLSETLHLPPLLLMIPATISCSFAFMLPVATPPNAIIFGSRLVTIPQMAKTGFAINIAGAVWITFFMYMYAGKIFPVG